MRKSIFWAILNILVWQSAGYAQDKPTAKLPPVTARDFSLPASPVIDSNANAVILSDIGSVHFIGNKKSSFSYVYKKHTRIKILNKRAFDLATVKISLYTPYEDPDKIDNISASTYNLENGQVTETKPDKKDVFEEKTSVDFTEEKFTIPAVKEGSIIEYTFTIISEYDFNLPGWTFQSENYPCLWSEYSVNIPQALFYVFVRQGIHPFAVDKGSKGGESYAITPKETQATMGSMPQDMIVTTNTLKHLWVMKDIPAFHREPYLFTPKNYVDKIDFQLSRTYNGIEYNDVMINWRKTSDILLNISHFGLPLSDEGDWVKDLADKVTANISSPVDKAKAIYKYVNGRIAYANHNNSIYLTTNLQDIISKNSGSVADINLLLIALMRREGLQADPVLLSTREFGFNLPFYPELPRLNYVIARLKVYDKVYYLDAAHPQLGFGQLAGYCYNGHARIISYKDSGSVYFEADSLKEKKNTTILISSTDKGLEGTYQSILGEQESYNTRVRVSEKGQAEYFKSWQTSLADDMEISNTGIDSLKSPDDPVRVYYDFVLKQLPGASLIYLNPLFGDALKENPFKAEERKYPVEMPYAMDNMYIFSMEIPAGYAVDELPKSVRVAFNGDQGMFEYLLDKQGDRIQLRCHLKLNRAYFPPEDYSNLRDFFGFVVKKESEQIVLKKK